MRRNLAPLTAAGLVAAVLLVGCSSGKHTSAADTASGAPGTFESGAPTVTVTDSAPISVATTGTSPSGTSPSSAVPSGPASSPAPAGPPACATSALQLNGGAGNGAGGTEYYTYTLRNAGKSTCSLLGYPGVSVIDEAGRLVQQPAVRSAGLAPSGARTGRLTLTSGMTAEFILSVVDVDPDTACPGPRIGNRLRVYPPNQTAYLLLGGRPLQACSAHVSPMFLR